MSIPERCGMTAPGSMSYRGRPCRLTEMKVGNTLFTVISVQSEKAGETAYDKVKRLILADMAAPGEKTTIIQNQGADKRCRHTA